MDHLEAYKKLRENGFRVSVGTGRGEEEQFTVTAFTHSDSLFAPLGISVRVVAETIQDGLILVERRVNETVTVMKECAENAGEEYHKGWMTL